VAGFRVDFDVGEMVGIGAFGGDGLEEFVEFIDLMFEGGELFRFGDDGGRSGLFFLGGGLRQEDRKD
jgi:hypothetical protein